MGLSGNIPQNYEDLRNVVGQEAIEFFFLTKYFFLSTEQRDAPQGNGLPTQTTNKFG